MIIGTADVYFFFELFTICQNGQKSDKQNMGI